MGKCGSTLSDLANNVYTVTASSMVNSKVRTLAGHGHGISSQPVFDYEYFLNNWGWWWGTPIYGEGGQRSNWDFDFQGRPDGERSFICGDPSVEQNEQPYVIGTAGAVCRVGGMLIPSTMFTMARPESPCPTC